MKNNSRILFIGTDGSGKTSLSEACISQMPDAVYFYYGLKDYKISFLKGVNTDRLYFRYFFFPLECFFRNISLPKNKIIFFDRMPGWIYSKSNLGSLLLRFCLPKVDILILCEAPAEVIFARKPERDVISLEKDIKKWRHFYNLFPASKKFIVNTNKNNIEQATNLVLSEIEKS